MQRTWRAADNPFTVNIFPVVSRVVRGSYHSSPALTKISCSPTHTLVKLFRMLVKVVRCVTNLSPGLETIVRISGVGVISHIHYVVGTFLCVRRLPVNQTCSAKLFVTL